MAALYLIIGVPVRPVKMDSDEGIAICTALLMPQSKCMSDFVNCRPETTIWCEIYILLPPDSTYIRIASAIAVLKVDEVRFSTSHYEPKETSLLPMCDGLIDLTHCLCWQRTIYGVRHFESGSVRVLGPTIRIAGRIP